MPAPPSAPDPNSATPPAAYFTASLVHINIYDKLVFGPYPDIGAGVDPGCFLSSAW